MKPNFDLSWIHEGGYTGALFLDHDGTVCSSPVVKELIGQNIPEGRDKQEFWEMYSTVKNPETDQVVIDEVIAVVASRWDLENNEVRKIFEVNDFSPSVDKEAFESLQQVCEANHIALIMFTQGSVWFQEMKILNSGLGIKKNQIVAIEEPHKVEVLPDLVNVCRELGCTSFWYGDNSRQCIHKAETVLQREGIVGVELIPLDSNRISYTQDTEGHFTTRNTCLNAVKERISPYFLIVSPMRAVYEPGRRV